MALDGSATQQPFLEYGTINAPSFGLNISLLKTFDPTFPAAYINAFSTVGGRGGGDVGVTGSSRPSTPSS